MKQSQLFAPTTKEIPSDAIVISHQLLLRAGFIRQVAAGVYSYLPLAIRVINKIENIIREEMNAIGANEMLVPAILPAELWEKSGRYKTYGPLLYRFSDRHDRKMILGPTHEETFAQLFANDIKSYKKLPLMVYQIQAKYRDEFRPRNGLLRGREFLMKDAYSFSADENGLDTAFNLMEQAYRNIFDRIGLNYRVINADAGAMGGTSSKEFSAIATTGEDIIAYSDEDEYASNIETAKDNFAYQEQTTSFLDKQLVDTPNAKTVEEVAEFLGIQPSQIIKTIIFKADNQLVAVSVRGDYEVNEVKVKNYLGVDELVAATQKDIEGIIDAEFGSLGPVDLPDNVQLYVDELAANMTNATAGANQNGKHIQNVNYQRDFSNGVVNDFRIVHEGEVAFGGKGELKFTKGIEIGHVFKLGTKFSKALGAQVQNENGQLVDMLMGSYGIGVSRLLSAVAEQSAEEKGFVWPTSIAPFDVHIIPVNLDDEDQKKIANYLVLFFEEKEMSVLLDDRNERPGVKFADSDLFGVPVRIVIGNKASQGIVEVVDRIEKNSFEETIESVKNHYK